MGKQTTNFKLVGTIKDTTYYEHPLYGFLYRRKGGVAAERIATDPAFEATRRNATDFGTAAKAAKLLRGALTYAVGPCNDAELVQRFTQRMVKVVQSDATNDKGARRAAKGNHGIFAGFAFGDADHRDGFLANCPVKHDHLTGTITLHTPKPRAAPLAAHYRILLECATVDFDAGTFSCASAETEGDADDTPTGGDLTLTVKPDLTTKDPVFVAVCVLFYTKGWHPMYQYPYGGIAAVIMPT